MLKVAAAACTHAFNEQGHRGTEPSCPCLPLLLLLKPSALKPEERLACDSRHISQQSRIHCASRRETRPSTAALLRQARPSLACGSGNHLQQSSVPQPLRSESGLEQRAAIRAAAHEHGFGAVADKYDVAQKLAVSAITASCRVRPSEASRSRRGRLVSLILRRPACSCSRSSGSADATARAAAAARAEAAAASSSSRHHVHLNTASCCRCRDTGAAEVR